MNVVLVGPLGEGHCLSVEDYAPRDGGTVCLAHCRVPVWDAAMVAFALSGWDHRCELVANHQGHGAQGRDLRAELDRRGIGLHEIGGPEQDGGAYQIDFIIDCRMDATRTWYSHIDHPDLEAAVAQALACVRDADASVLYLDHWTSLDALEALRPLRSIPDNTHILYNVGDCEHVTDEVARCASHLGDRPCLFQVSNKGATEPSALIEELDRLNLSDAHAVLLTQGAQEALLAYRGTVEVVEIQPAMGAAMTVGAGALLSAFIIDRLADRGFEGGLLEIVQQATRRASETVANDALTNYLGY